MLGSRMGDDIDGINLCPPGARKKKAEKEAPRRFRRRVQDGVSELLLHSGTKLRTNDPGGLTVAGNTLSTTSAVRAAMSQA